MISKPRVWRKEEGVCNFPVDGGVRTCGAYQVKGRSPVLFRVSCGVSSRARERAVFVIVSLAILMLPTLF